MYGVRKNFMIGLPMMLLIGIVLIGPLSAQSTSSPGDGVQALQNIQNAFRAVARKVIPAVVEVNVVDIVKQQVQRFDSPFDFFFGPQQGDKSKQPEEREFRRPGLGSGVVVRRNGEKVYVLTNNHVVGDAEEISVGLSDGRSYDARLVGKDEKKDLALIVFETKENIPIAELGNSDELQVGDWALAIGNPLGFESTLTSGIISAIGRRSVPGSSMSNYTDYIQTDAAINQGNSGGALVNIRSQVIGINTWIASPSGGNIGLGFAIPINNAKKAIEDFITKGKVEYGWLGITVGNIPDGVAEDLGVKGKNGAFVYGVFKDSPADTGNIVAGDFVTKIGSEEIRDSNHLLRIIGDIPPGERTRFELLREGRQYVVQVRLAARADEAELAKQRNTIYPGMSVVKFTENIRKQLNLPRSVGEVIIGVVDRESPAAIAGFRTGDIVKKINGKDVQSIADFYRIINDKSSTQMMFTIYRQGSDILLGLVR